jgi:hypothetical protein
VWKLLIGGGLLAIAVVALVQHVGGRTAKSQLTEAAAELLSNWHPRSEATVRERLAQRARDLGVRLAPEDIRLGKRRVEQETAVSRFLRNRAGQAVHNVEVSIEIRFRTSLLGFERTHHVRVARVITLEGSGDGGPEEPERGRGLPLPSNLDE